MTITEPQTPGRGGAASPAGPRAAHARAPEPGPAADADLCLATAGRLLAEVPAGARGTWPRACVWLIRLALEAELDAFWLRACPAVGACESRRAQFLMLPRHADPALARRAHQVWAAASQAGHHRAYEVGLAATEVRALLAETTAVVAALRASTATR